MRARGIPRVIPLTRLVEAQRRQLFTFSAVINCQIIRTQTYTGRAIPHPYREEDPTCIQRERSHIYTERAELGFKRSDNRLIFRDNNGSMPLVMGTSKSY